MNWSELEGTAPELARLGAERFQRTQVVLVGTIRRDGSPRISPCEFFFFEGQLFLGMMWQSRKALDLLRDPRCLVHSAVIDKSDPLGEFKLRGRAVDVQDPDVQERYGRALYEKINWRPEGPFHLFRIDIESAVHIAYAENGDQLVRQWRPGRPERERRRHWTGSGVVDEDT